MVKTIVFRGTLTGMDDIPLPPILGGPGERPAFPAGSERQFKIRETADAILDDLEWVASGPMSGISVEVRLSREYFPEQEKRLPQRWLARSARGGLTL